MKYNKLNILSNQYIQIKQVELDAKSEFKQKIKIIKENMNKEIIKRKEIKVKFIKDASINNENIYNDIIVNKQKYNKFIIKKKYLEII